MANWICVARDCPEGALVGIDLIGIAVALFIAIVFLQSGLDKALDWKGNLAYLGQLFAKSPLAGSVAPLLGVVTVISTDQERPGLRMFAPKLTLIAVTSSRFVGAVVDQAGLLQPAGE